MIVCLETGRLILRRFTEDDVDDLVALNADPDVMRYLTGGAPIPREEIERVHLPRHLASYGQSKGYGTWAAVEKGTGDFLGWFHLGPEPGRPDDQPELGYRLLRSAWGKGYGTEGSRALIDKGFRELGVSRVTASTYQDNRASRRVMEKAGMRLVRTYRPSPQEVREMFGAADIVVFDGDEVEYAITKPEWERMAQSGA